ncbi:hypothetical protein EDD17DRAFT_1881720 [Pisolithus thermaeus]|nr:hypothetical protein EDD17DRAFT_1881720 [Pisolithus thermaeus]
MAKSQASNPGKSSKPSSQLLSVKKSKKSAAVDSVDSEKENNLGPSKKRILIRVTLHRDALELRPVENDEYDRSTSLNEVAVCFSDRYEKLGAVDDLEEAITLGWEVLALCPPGHPHRDMSLNNLGAHLLGRFMKKAEICDLEEAIQLLHAALELQPPGHPDRSAPSFFVSRIDMKISELELRPRGNAGHVKFLHKLACDLRTRFTQTAETCNLEESITLHRAALEQRPPGHPARSSTLRELALCLSLRHDKHRVADDLEEAVKLGHEALELCPSMHPGHDACLHNLACDLRRMFVKTEAICDLEESIKLLRAALERRPPDHPTRSSALHGLALCLSNRYDKLGVVDDLEEAVTLGREALERCPSAHPGHGKSLQCLAHDLRKRFEQTTTIGDLDESIELLRPALELCPIGHPAQSSLLHELALCLSHRHDKHGVADDLEEAILRGHAALELCPPGHPDRGVVLYSCACDYWKKFQYLHQAEAVGRAPSKVELTSSLFELSQHLWEQFQKQKVMVTDLDHSIYLATYALELRLPPEDVSVAAWVGRLAKVENSDEPVVLERVVDNLRALANYHRARFQAQHAIIDLHEAIAFYRHMLCFRPAGHPDRASSLHDLACCLADQFREQPAEADLDEAIALEQEALCMIMRRAPDYHVSRLCLTAYLQMKFNSRVAMMSLGASGVTPLDMKQVIRNVAFETLKTLPTRLLHTPTGRLCNRDVQILYFLQSPECKQLESSCMTCDRDQQMKLIHCDTSRYFQYITLSHRWGEYEPSLRDIEDHTIYNMSVEGGFGKLQAFCRVALELDYLWAWSDTCCIDKDSSAEVQETIGSMFAWYRKSALTIVHLSDVTDTASLRGSEWFRRGWTLQELLAPRNVVFYTENWSLYKNPASSNHKTDVAVLAELENETRIDRRFLTNFSPGLDDARSRLQWASLRHTTCPEDITYSLFGISPLAPLWGCSHGLEIWFPCWDELIS